MTIVIKLFTELHCVLFIKKKLCLNYLSLSFENHHYYICDPCSFKVYLIGVIST